MTRFGMTSYEMNMEHPPDPVTTDRNAEDDTSIRRLLRSVDNGGNDYHAETTSHSVVSSVLTMEECDDAIDSIWLFLNYTTYGRIHPHDPNTWSHLSRYKKAHHSSDKIDALPANSHTDDYLWNTNGAGYLLSIVHDILADRVFRKIFDTSQLHTSKEGFYFRPISTNATANVAGGTCTDCSDIEARLLLFQHPTVAEGGVNASKSTFIRSMVAFDDMKLSLHTDQDQNQSSDSPIIHLKKGDVFLWRTNGGISAIYATATTETKMIAAFYCTMQPAKYTPEAIFSMKVESYRQRQTSTHRLDVEEWMHFHSKRNANNYDSHTGNRAMITRQYFDTGPPLVTMKLAELYGLVPYCSCDATCGIDDDHSSDRQQRAIIRGVQFYDNSIVTSHQLIASPASSKALDEAGRLIHLTTHDPNEMIGQEKYLGGMASSCQRYVYGVPGGARRVLRIRLEDGHMDCIGPSYNGKFKWLRGVTVCASIMNLDPRYPCGCCLALPCNAASVLKINPYTNEVYTFGEEVLKDCGSDRWHYHGGNVSASNGWLYAIPANANRVIKINPLTDEVVFIGPTFHSGGQKWFGGITGTDGCIYGIPHNETSVLKIDPTDDSISLMRLDNNQPLPTGQWKWHGGLRAGDKIFGFPNNADNVLVIHCRENRVYTIDSITLESGRHRIPQDNGYKYLGGATTIDERYAYLFPCDAERVLRIDCMTDELCFVGPHLLDGANKFQNGFAGRDGCIYGIPQRATGVLRVTPHTVQMSSDQDVVEIMDCGPELIGVKDKFEGGVLGPDGCIYCIPLRSKSCIKIVPGKAINP